MPALLTEFLGVTPVVGDDTLVVTEQFHLIKPSAGEGS
jgi:hypothetical protein